MKKFLAMLLACMMLALPAMAEGDAAENADTVDANAEKVTMSEEERLDLEEDICYFGRWVSVAGEDGGCIDICLPRFWVDYDVTAENEETVFKFDENACYAAVGGDGFWGMYVLWTEMDAETDAAALQAEYAAEHEDAAVVNLNGVDFVQYTDTDRDAVMLLWPRATGMYSIAIGPASDTDIVDYVEDIIRTVDVYESAE